MLSDDPWVIILATIVLIGLSAFFVAIEFATLAAKRHRLTATARHSRSARAALRNSTELTVLLAGAQLGITVCTLALGAVTKPAIHHWLMVPLENLGVPPVAADITAFLLALAIVTFLHLVIGEMAPKSWAIAHPESSATLLALPMRGFMWLTRPLLIWLNNAANWCLRRVGVTPRDELATGQTSADLEHLVRHSANVGALDARFTQQLTEALELEHLTVAHLSGAGGITMVDASATVGEARAAALSSGHLRLVVQTADGVTGLLHVRDTLTRDAAEPVHTLIRPVLVFSPDTLAYQAVAELRATRNQLAVVGTPQRPVGVFTLADIVQRILPGPQDGPTAPDPAPTS